MDFFHHTAELLEDIALATVDWADDVGLVDAFEEAGEWVVTQVDAAGNAIEEVWQDFSEWVETDVTDWLIGAGETLDEGLDLASDWIINAGITIYEGVDDAVEWMSDESNWEALG